MSAKGNIEIEKLMTLFSNLNIDYLKISNEDMNIELKKENPLEKYSQLKELLEASEVAPLPSHTYKESEKREGMASEDTEELRTAQVSPESEVDEEEEDVHIITSPIIGTFYRAPAPGEEPFVEIGDKVKIGDVLCIIEAMKVMNRIESDVSGEVIGILTEDGDSVEYSTPLIKVKQF